jgi:fimbrial chaperone protein
MHRAIASILLALAAASGAARASDLGVAPVVVQLDPHNQRTSLTVTNRGADPVVMQAEAVQWRRDASADVDLPTADLLVNPSVFTVSPGQSQLVRVGLRGAVSSQREETYRIVLREVPQPPRPGEVRQGGQVQVLMAMRVPVYVAPPAVARSLQWQATQAGDGSIDVSVRNGGNVHARVRSLQLRSAHGTAIAPEQAAVAVIFPGESRNFRVADAARAGAHPMTLEVTTDQGAQLIPVAALAHR